MNIEQIINEIIDHKINKLKEDYLKLSFLRLNQKLDKLDNQLHLKDVDSFEKAKEELHDEIEGSLDSLESRVGIIERDLDFRYEDLENCVKSNESDIHLLDLRIDSLENTLEELNLIDVKCLNDRLDYKCEHYDVTINALEKENELLKKKLERIESFFHQIGNYFDVFNDIQNDLEKK